MTITVQLFPAYVTLEAVDRLIRLARETHDGTRRDLLLEAAADEIQTRVATDVKRQASSDLIAAAAIRRIRPVLDQIDATADLNAGRALVAQIDKARQARP